VHALAAAPLGLLIGLSLGALGAGGSVLAVPALVYVAGESARRATTTSLLVVGAAALVGMAAHYRGGRVRVGTGVAFGLAGVGGSVAGTALNGHVDPNLLLLAFSGLVVMAAWRMVTGCPTCTQVGERRELSRTRPVTRFGPIAVALQQKRDLAAAVMVLAAGSGIGFLTGLFGVGGGFVIVPALTLMLGLNMPEAIGTSLLVIAINSAAALTDRAVTATIDWGIALPFTLAAIVGVLAGKGVGQRLEAQRSLRWFAALLIVVALFTAIRATTGLAT
jgi:uncharacterized membrane protein YfcA